MLKECASSGCNTQIDTCTAYKWRRKHYCVECHERAVIAKARERSDEIEDRRSYRETVAFWEDRTYDPPTRARDIHYEDDPFDY